MFRVLCLKVSSGAYAFIVGFCLTATGNCRAETALEAITRASKNPLTKPTPNASLLSPKKFEAAIGNAKALTALPSANTADAEAKPTGVLATQRVEEIVVEAQREPEDVVPKKKPAFQKMKEMLDGVGKSVEPVIAEANNNGGTRTAVFKRSGACYSIKNNAGQMNNDGSLGSAGSVATTCSSVEAAAK
jgi:hypothetical protein